MPHGNALAKVDLDPILERIADGQRLSDIAPDYGVTFSGLAYKLRTAAAEQYAQAQIAGAEIRLDRAERGIEVADDGFQVARAREIFRAAAWRCEREHPSRWASKQQITHEVGADLGDLLRDARKRVLIGQSSTVDGGTNGGISDADDIGTV